MTHKEARTLLISRPVYMLEDVYEPEFQVSSRRELYSLIRNRHMAWNLDQNYCTIYSGGYSGGGWIDHKIVFDDPLFYPDLYSRLRMDRNRGSRVHSSRYVREILREMKP